MNNKAVNGTKASNSLGSPSLADVGVIALVPDEWEIPWQPRHQVLTRLYLGNDLYENLMPDMKT